MNRGALIFILSFLFPFILNAASVGDKVSGYVILNNGKKLEGRIVIGTLLDNEVEVKFISKNKNIQKAYFPKDLQAYGYQVNDIDELGMKVQTWVNYKRHKVDQPPYAFGPTLVFLQMIEQGNINLYSYFVEAPKQQTQDYSYIFYVEMENTLLLRMSKDSFSELSKSIFKDYTALTSKVGSEYFLYRNLDQMVRDFNFWMVNKHDKNEYRMAMKIEKKEALEGADEF